MVSFWSGRMNVLLQKIKMMSMWQKPLLHTPAIPTIQKNKNVDSCKGSIRIQDIIRCQNYISIEKNIFVINLCSRYHLFYLTQFNSLENGTLFQLKTHLHPILIPDIGTCNMMKVWIFWSRMNFIAWKVQFPTTNRN